MRRYICILLTMFLPLIAWSQHEKELEHLRKQRDDFKRQRLALFQTYKDSLNKDFAKMMEQKWEDYQVFVGNKRPSKPEPSQLPVAPKDSEQRESLELPVNQIVPAEEEEPSSINRELEETHKLQDANQTPHRYMNVDVNFYMEKVHFDIPANYESLLLGGISEKSVAKFWSDLAEGDYNQCVLQLKNQRQTMHLNDWALYDMAVSMAGETFSKRYAEQTIFAVFVLNQLGLEAKVGRTDNQLVVLMPAKTVIYAVSYVLFENTPYYIFSCYPKEQRSMAAISTYSVDFPNPTSPLDMNIYEPIRFVKQPSAVTYTSDYWGDAVPFQINQNAIDFYGKYPQVDVVFYANAEMSEELKDWADKQIKPFLNDLDEYEAVNVLLYFVQTEFEYASDLDQFGYEKPFFCEENFYYAKNDCEDRAILFSYLVRNLVGAKIVLLDYPDHLATAVCLKDDTIKGDYYMVDGRKYYVCDPTYIGANIGETMPQYRKTKADVIILK